MASTIDSIRRRVRTLPAVGRIVAVNVAVFVVLRLVAAAGLLSGHGEAWADAAVRFVSMPSAPAEIVSSPWTVLLYMVAQYDPLHLMLNVMMLLWFALAAGELLTRGRLLLIYIFGGLAGAAAYLVVNALSASVGTGALIGSSASVMAIVAAVTVAVPDRRIGLLFFGMVKTKWVAAGVAVIALIGLSGHSGGVNAAHAGGIAAGIIAGLMLRRGEAGSSRNIPQATMTDTEALDSLLDKVRRSGYESLDAAEKAELHNLSQRLNRDRS